MAEVHASTEQYVRGSNDLAETRDSLQKEERVLNIMRTSALVVGAIALVGVLVFIAFYIVPRFLEDPSMAQYVSVTGVGWVVLITIGKAILPIAIVAFIPAGVIGMWRWMSRSEHTAWGGAVLWVFLLSISLSIPIMFGLVFFIAQYLRVNNLRCDVRAAEKERNESSACIH